MERIDTGLKIRLITSVLIILLASILAGPAARAQTQGNMTVTVMVRPPYGTMLWSYAEQTRINIVSPYSIQGTLSVRIRGNNGIDLITGPDYPGTTINIMANTINQFGGNELAGYFEYQNLISRGVPMQEIIEKGLPEGRYQICFKVYGPDGGLLSGDEPLGCSNFFNIRYGEPPMTVNPQCGARLTQSPVQSIVFSWTPATNAPAWTNYTLKIVEMLDSTQNPAAAMLSATEPSFFETTLQGGFSFLYGPSQPLLEKGRFYAWQVIAEERESNARFSNNGRSPVCWFKWDPSQPGMIQVPIAEEKPYTNQVKKSSVTNSEPVPISVITGNLNYKFKTTSSSSSSSQKASGQSATAGNTISASGINAMTSSGGGGVNIAHNLGEITYNTDNISPANSSPLANVKLSLVVNYVLVGTINGQYSSGQPIDMSRIRNRDAFGEKFQGHEKVLATTTTGPDGSFSFLFMNTEKDLGKIEDKTSWTSGGGEFFDKIEGNVFRVIRLRVEDKYYCSPDINLKLEPWEALDLGTLVSYVKSYNLKVHTIWSTIKFWDVIGGLGKDLDKVKTTIVRRTEINGIPRDEVVYPVSGSIPTFNLFPKKLKTDYTKGDGTVTFTNLVQHDPDNKQDRYYVLCEPDDFNEFYIFKKREKSYYALELSDKKKFPFNSQRDEGQSGSGNTESLYGENITWNSQLEVRTYEFTLELTPDKPRVTGKVEAIDVGEKPLSNIPLAILNTYKQSSNFNKPVLNAKTDGNGYYEFNNLDPEIGALNSEGIAEITGPSRILICSAPGFKGEVRELGILLWGQKMVIPFNLEPDGLFSGYVVDEEGNAVAAHVQIDDLAFTSTTTKFEYDEAATKAGGKGATGTTGSAGTTGGTTGTTTGGTGGLAGSLTSYSTYQTSSGAISNLSSTNTSQSYMPTGVKQVFSLKAPSGNNRSLRIVPRDPGYSAETYTVDVKKAPPSGTPDQLNPYVVYKMKKRVRFMVAEKPSGGITTVAALKPVPNAVVTLKLPGAEVVRTTGNDGYVLFEFDNNGSSFTFEIKAPANVDLEDASYTINNVQDSKTPVNHTPALLRKTVRISGKVSLSSNLPVNSPVEGATVYLEMGNGTRIETKTNKNGDYLLTKVPGNFIYITIWASKPGAVPNIVSQSKQILVKDVNVVDFVLSVDKEIAIENIFGFDVDLKKTTKNLDGSWVVSGALVNLPSNPNFKTSATGQTIPFTNLKIIKGAATTSSGIPVGVPASNEFDTDLKELSLILNGVFGVLQTPSSGEVIKISSQNGKGEIRGKAGILKTSFQFSDNYLTFTENIPLYLTPDPGSSQSAVVTITTADHPSRKWGLTGAGAGDINFRLLAFGAKADRAKSWLQDDRIGLTTLITTNEIAGMTPSKLSVDIGELIVRATKIEPVSGSKPLGFKLEKWDFVATGWSIQQYINGIYIPQGTIKTGLIDVPVKNVIITPDQLKIESFEIKNLTFSGVVPLNVITQNCSFGYNPSAGTDKKSHWELRIVGTGGNPGVSVSGLPGLPHGTEMKFQSFSLLSNGEQQISTGNQQQQYVFNKVLKVKPLTFSGGDKYFDMMCNVDLDIPRIEASSAIIRFSKPGSAILFEIFPFKVSFDGLGGVRFASDISQGSQKLQGSEFTAVGTITDKEGIKLKGKLHRTETAAWVDVDPKGQSMALGSGQTSFRNIEGKMEVVPAINDWSKFTFSGDMTGFNGMTSDIRKTFTVHGSITADNESLGVKNVPTSFGGMSFTYDIKNARMTGSLDINKSLGAVKINGLAEILVDAAGWYFLMGGELTAPGFGNMSVGMLMGDYRIMTPYASQKVMQFAYNKNVPQTIASGVSGFFITGKKDVPIINIPSFEINLGLVNAKLGVTAGLDARLWMGFDGSGNEYGFGAMAFVHAYFKATSITCTQLSAEARVELGATGIYQSNTGIFTAAGCGSFTIGGSVKQCFPTPCWSRGVCCTNCIGAGISQGIRLDLLFDSKGNTSMDFGFGNCSGQTSLTGK